jgi:hypothetical protein
MSTPIRSLARASELNSICFAIMFYSSLFFAG